MTSLLPLRCLLLPALIGLLAPLAGRAQVTTRDLYDISSDMYREANSPEALARYNQALILAPEAYLVSMGQPGTLLLSDNRRIKAAAMRYNVAVDLVEATDSTGAHVWPVGSLRGFSLGRGSDARRFRTLEVRNGSARRKFVEVLTTAENGPVLLGLVHAYTHHEAEIDPVLRTEKRKARTEIGQTVVASTSPNEPLRPLVLTRKNVLRLFGTRAAEMEAYAAKENLAFTDLGQVLRVVEQFNRVAAQ